MPAVPKPSHARGSKHRRNITHISDRARQTVYDRSGGFCERCGVYCVGRGGEVAHLVGAGQLGHGDQPWNLVLLCGSSVNSGTCHHFIDHRKKSGGGQWAEQKRVALMELYDVRICTSVLCHEETDLRDASGDPICKNCIELFPERMQPGTERPGLLT